MASRYQTIQTTKLNVTGSLYYVTNVYPEIAPTDNDYYVITTVDDRLDLLAYDFYQDSSLWWIISSANSLPGDSIYPPVGIQLRIPQDIQSILTTYNRVNNVIR
jgi:hypothetical protein